MKLRSSWRYRCWLADPGANGSPLRQPVVMDPEVPHWTVFELAGHFDIAIGLTRMLIAGRDVSQPAPVVYDYAYKMVQGSTPADMPGVLHETFSKSVAEARAVPADTVGPGYFAPMRADEFVASLAQALGQENIATAASLAMGRAPSHHGDAAACRAGEARIGGLDGGRASTSRVSRVPWSCSGPPGR